MTINFITRSLRQWRKKRTQAEAAALLKVPLATYRNWEQGRNRPGALAWKALKEHMKSTK